MGGGNPRGYPINQSFPAGVYPAPTIKLLTGHFKPGGNPAPTTKTAPLNRSLSVGGKAYSNTFNIKITQMKWKSHIRPVSFNNRFDCDPKIVPMESNSCDQRPNQPYVGVNDSISKPAISKYWRISPKEKIRLRFMRVS